MSGLVVDNFAGAGGASVGIADALGRSVDYAINHDAEAIETHELNHPETKHLIEDVFDVDPVELCAGRAVDLAWFSPDCTHHSRAKGGKPLDNKRRGLAWVVIRWASAVKPAVIMLENVPEFKAWGPLTAEGTPCKRRSGETFRSWVGELRRLGYDVQWRELVAADYGAPTIRKRLFLVARCDGQPIRWPEKTHAPRDKSEQLGLKPWRSASECVDWSLLCPSIFLTKEEGRAVGVKRPLADATMRRIARGIQRYVVDADEPFVVSYAQHGGANRSVNNPMHTITASGKDQNCIIAPSLIQTGYGERPGQKPRSLDIGKPLGVVPAGGCKHGLVAAFLAKHNGGATGQGVQEPLHTIAGNINKSCVFAFLQKYYGNEKGGVGIEGPMHTVPTVDRFGLVTVASGRYSIVDIGMRMLQPHELLKAQFGRFANTYKLVGTKRRKVAGIGNSVCPEVASALVRSNVPLGSGSSYVTDRGVLAEEACS